MTRYRPNVRPLLTGDPNPPHSVEVVLKAQALYDLLSHGGKPPDGMQSAIVVFGNAAFLPAIPLIEQALNSTDPDVRTFALQALVLDFHLPQYCEVAWDVLDDPDPDPRRIAAGCLGLCYWATREPSVLKPLAAIVLDEAEDSSVRQAAYAAIFDVLGYPYRHPKRAHPSGSMDLNKGLDRSLISRLLEGEAPAPEEL